MSHKKKGGYQPEPSEKPLHEGYQPSADKQKVPLKPPSTPPRPVKPRGFLPEPYFEHAQEINSRPRKRDGRYRLIIFDTGQSEWN